MLPQDELDVKFILLSVVGIVVFPSILREAAPVLVPVGGVLFHLPWKELLGDGLKVHGLAEPVKTPFGT
jgi:hypothetical protein